MMDFPQEVLSAQKVIFKPGALNEFANEVREFGSSGMIVHGRSFEKNGLKKKIENDLSFFGKVDFYCRGGGEPSLDEVTEVIGCARLIGAEWIAGIGGGRVLDLAKAAAGLFHTKEAPLFYQEGGKLEKEGIPFVAVPTTAGTGSEATINSVIVNFRNKTKLSIRDKSFLARKIILDPELLKTLSGSALSYSGMDALVQGYEAFISKKATWYSDTFALKSIELISFHLIPAFETRKEEHLSALLLGSYFAGVALASARLGVIHGIAHPLGALYDLPHGLICSVCFIPSIQLNRDAMGKKYELMSQAVQTDFEEKVRELLSRLRITSPFRGKPVIEKEKIIRETLQSGSTAANPKTIVRADVEFLLRQLF